MSRRLPTCDRRQKSFRSPSRFILRAISGAFTVTILLFSWSCGSSNRPPNILLVTLDTTRADHLGCYGYDRDTSPNLDRLAEISAVYTRAYATSSWTLPTHASLFTGKYPTSHGAQYDPEGPLQLTQGIEGPDAWNQYRARDLSDEETTLAELLDRRNYRTGAVVAGPWMKKVFGLGKGFKHYDDDGINSVRGRLAEDVTKNAIEWIREKPEEPFFLFLNYYDPHGPFDPPGEYKWSFLPRYDQAALDAMEETDKILALYDGEIRYTDAEFGRLLDELDRLDLTDDTWIIITADHGEILGEKGAFGHGGSLTEAEIRVPLIVKEPSPRAKGTRNDTPVQVTGVLPMIAKRLGLTLPPQVQGRPLPEPSPAVFAEVYPIPIAGAADWQTILVDGYKYARSTAGEELLVDPKLDPAEEHNLIEKFPERAKELSETLDRFLAGLPRHERLDGPIKNVDPETLKALQNLGYLDEDKPRKEPLEKNTKEDQESP